MSTSSLELKLTTCLTKYNIHITLSKNNICLSPKGEGPNNNQTPQVDLTLTERESGNHTSKKHHSNIQAARFHTRHALLEKEKSLRGLCICGSLTESQGPKRIVRTSHRSLSTQASSSYRTFISRLTTAQTQTTWLSPDSRASHPLVTNAAEEISN
jgi:hypothetical protein